MLATTAEADVGASDPLLLKVLPVISWHFPGRFWAFDGVDCRDGNTGQAINVKESGERYLLTVIDGESKLPQSHTILEIGQDFVVVKDFTGLNETRMPITSVKAVIHFKGFERK